MAKRLKLRICRVITTTLQSCRSKDPSILPQINPVPSLISRPNKSSAVRSSNHLSSSFISTTVEPHHQFKWQKEDKWHVVAKIHAPPRRKIYNSSDNSSDEPHTLTNQNKRIHKKKKKNVRNRINHRISTSSAESEEETETLVSSSIDEFNNVINKSRLQPIRETQTFTSNLPNTRINNTHNKRRSTNRKRTITPPPPTAAVVAEVEIPARLSVFKKLIPCTVLDGKVKESFAIVKRSSDPYEDFKNSMMDMILEKHMFDPKDLEQLLQCFLSLNSRHYHGVIVEAFSEIWEALFCSPNAHHSKF